MKTKRTFKAVTAMLLALILSLGSMTSAFAVNVGETIEWPATEEYEYTDIYIYKGELSEGSNPIKEEIEDYWVGGCYTFEVEKAGYYLFTYGYDFVLSISEETVDGEPRNFAATVNAYSGEGDAYKKNLVAHLSEGTVYVGLDYYSNYADDKIVIEYIGEELVDVEIDESQLQNLVMDYDFGYGSGKGFDLQRDITLVFADGSKRTFEGAYIRFVADSSSGEAEEGENTVTTANTFGIEKQYTMTCYPATHFIKKVEISNLDKYLKAVKYYSPYGDYGFDLYGTDEDEDGIQGETITVTLNDGTTQTKELCLYEPIIIELANGSEIYLYYGEGVIEDELCFAVTTANETVLLKEDIEVTEATAAQNIERLGVRIKRQLSSMVNNIGYWINVITNPEEYPYYSTAEAMLYLVEGIGTRLSRVFSEIRDCCEHLILS